MDIKPLLKRPFHNWYSISTLLLTLLFLSFLITANMCMALLFQLDLHGRTRTYTKLIVKIQDDAIRKVATNFYVGIFTFLLANMK